MRVGFIGLGNMGLPIARNLLRAGYELVVHNRTRSREDELVAEGARAADSPADAARGADVLMTMLADDGAIETVMFGPDGALRVLPAGAVHCSLSTISPTLSERLSDAHRELGGRYVAAPVFGRPEAAEGGKLWVVASGPGDAIDICAPLFEVMAQGTRRVGDAPSTANMIKLAGNFMIAAMIEAIGEAFALVRRSDVEPAAFLELINTLLFKSPIYQSYGTIIAEERFDPAAFKLHLGLKDIRLALAAADTAGVPMPLGSLLHDNFLAAVGRGKGEIDWAGLAGHIAENAGLPGK